MQNGAHHQRMPSTMKHSRGEKPHVLNPKYWTTEWWAVCFGVAKMEIRRRAMYALTVNLSTRTLSKVALSVTIR